MSRIARSTEPLYQTRGDPVSWPIAFTDPETRKPLDPAGASVSAVLAWDGASQALTVSALDAACSARITGASNLTVGLPLGQVSELQVAFTDSLGAVTRYVWPVKGETP